MNIILFGPPGIGKSTIIGVLKRSNIAAIDLEDVYPSNIRFQLPSMVDGVVFGAADLNPKRNYTNAIKVLLTYDTQEEYNRARSIRDRMNPGKKSQMIHNLDDWLKGTHYDYILSLTPYKGSPYRAILDERFVDAVNKMVHNTPKKFSCETVNLAKRNLKIFHA